ncbi:hypothetical protein niasHS_013703 [Heterodera schachtii]|uniref:Uncharacterized protein n=1 Tax=Heterodera schachtii TaxID=97005 RepID=A0ABD2IK52_HETSC
MSAHFRTTIGLIHPDAVQIVNNQRDFPVPARPQGQPDNVYQRQIQTIIHDLDDEATDVSDFLTQLTDMSDRWMSLRTSMTGNERTADNTIYDDFVATTPFPQTLNNLKSPLPISDQSYNDALDLLTKSYDNPEDVARSLHNSLKNLPRVRGGDGFCPDLRSLLDQIECICVQMKQQNQSYDNTAFHMEIEQRLPRFVLEEIFRAKEEADDWSTDKLKDQLRNILRRREQIDSGLEYETPLNPFKLSLTFSKHSTTPLN